MKYLKHHLRFFLLAIGVVLVWRGIWGFADMYLFPADRQISLAISIVLGITILFFTDRKLNELLG